MDDIEITKEVLELLAVYVRKPYAHGRTSQTELYLDNDTLEKLFCWGTGWGPVAGLISSLNEKVNIFFVGFDYLHLFSKFSQNLPLYFEFYADPSDSTNIFKTANEKQPNVGENVIQMSNLHAYKETPYQMLVQLINSFSVPQKYHFPLYTRIFISKIFPDAYLRQQVVYLRLVAFTILGNSLHKLYH